MKLNQHQKERIRKDYETWNGGFAPESDHQCRVYVDYSLEENCDPEIVYHWLKQQIGKWK